MAPCVPFLCVPFLDVELEQTEADRERQQPPEDYHDPTARSAGGSTVLFEIACNAPGPQGAEGQVSARVVWNQGRERERRGWGDAKRGRLRARAAPMRLLCLCQQFTHHDPKISSNAAHAHAKNGQQTKKYSDA